MNTYITIQGQTWDMIALDVYGSELYADILMKNNVKLLDYYVFPQGIIINVPDLPDNYEEEEQPDWRSE